MATQAERADPSSFRDRVSAEARGAGTQAERSRARAALLALAALLSPFVHLTLTGRVVSLSLALMAIMIAAALGLAVWSMVVHRERSRALRAAAQAI